MLQILTNRCLRHLNSFGLAVKTSKLFEPESLEELCVFFSQQYAGEPFILLGEGSNTLFTRDYEGLVVHPCIPGITVLEETADEVLIEVGAGENWDNFVALAVEREWYGAENLSLIPGSVGSVPIQNIGAYGVEAAEIIDRVKVFDIGRCQQSVLAGKECRFGYRSSIFKCEAYKNLVVTSVVFRLQRSPHFRLDYGDLRHRFARFGSPSLKNLRQTIIGIRREKLPDPAVTGNGGSFFKNPVVSTDLHAEMRKQWPDIPGYPSPDNSVKIPAAWLIQECGWKGFREKDAGCWPTQPLVLVNYGNATGMEILELAEKIEESVEGKFGIRLEKEVRVI